MTILRLGNGDLVLYSPILYRESLREAIERFGPIRHLVAPSTGHWMFFGEWQRRCPGAKSWAVPELADRRAVRNAGLRFDALLGPQPPQDWAGAIDHVMFRGPGYGELAMHHAASGTLCVTDVMLQVRRERLPPLSRALAVAAGICAPVGRAPAQLRALLLMNREENAAAARRLVALRSRRLVPAHGDVVERQVTEHVGRSLAWLGGNGRAALGWTLAGLTGLAAAATLVRRAERRQRVRRVARRRSW